MISFRGSFDGDSIEAMFVQQVPGELSPGARIAVWRRAVALQDALHPQARPKNDDGKQQERDDNGHAFIVSRFRWLLLLSVAGRVHRNHA